MISLGRFLNVDREQAEACFRIIALLLEAIAQHAVEGDAAELETLRNEVSNALNKMVPETEPGELLVVAGSVTRTFEEYNKRITHHVRQHNSELQNIISMLTATMISISDSGERTSTRLQDIEKQLVSAAMIEDVRVLKHRLGECLESIREERKSQNEQATKMVQHLQQTIESAPKVENTPRVDSATGLPDRAAAEAALSEYAAANEPAYTLVFIADRVQLINARFGYAAGDEVLKTIQTHVRKGLRPDDRMFRWRGPSFLALLKRSDPVDCVRAEISRIVMTRLQKTFDIGNRSVLVPIGMQWALFPVSSSSKLLVHKIDHFVASNSPTHQ
jgi:diguanylate cyclase (GGDEF)-like protein